jgi:hypothetical protein
MSFLIKDTTKEERIMFVNKALAISQTGADAPDERTMELVNEYIEGRMELLDILKIIIEESVQND